MLHPEILVVGAPNGRRYIFLNFLKNPVKLKNIWGVGGVPGTPPALYNH